MYEWKDKVVVITGGANGIGAGVVRLVLDEGAKHIAILDIDEATGTAFQEEVNSKYGSGKTRFHKCDVTNDDQLFGAFDSLIENQGDVDIVINNAGIMNDSSNIYEKEIEINITAVVTSTLKAIELMRVDRGGKGGTVINIASIFGLGQTSFVAPVYCSTKAAVIHFSNCIGRGDYFAKTGVRVLTVCIGGTATSLISSAKMGSHDKNITPDIMYAMTLSMLYLQKTVSAARGVIEAYKRGASASTWIATRDLPPRYITDNVTRAFQIMGEYN